MIPQQRVHWGGIWKSSQSIYAFYRKTKQIFDVSINNPSRFEDIRPVQSGDPVEHPFLRVQQRNGIGICGGICTPLKMKINTDL
jgi:hypothetical protein